MKKFTAFLTAILITVFTALPCSAAASGEITVSGLSEIEGNIFYVTVTLDNCSSVFGGQGALLYNSEQIELLELVSYEPEGYRFNFYDNEAGQITYLIYRTHDASPELSVTQPLFNIYFQINTEPEDDTVSVVLTRGKLSDSLTLTDVADTSYSALIKNYVPPQTTAPVTTPPITETETDVPTVPITTEGTQTGTATDTTSVPTEDTEDSDTADTYGPDTSEVEPSASSDIPLTGTQTPSDNTSSDTGSKVMEIIFIALLCALISGGAVYFVMKRKQKTE